MIKQELLEQIIQDNDTTLDLAKTLSISQAGVQISIKRRTKKFIYDIRVIDFLRDRGFTDEEIFEPVVHKSVSNN